MQGSECSQLMSLIPVSHNEKLVQLALSCARLGHSRAAGDVSLSLVNHLYRTLVWSLSMCSFMMMAIFYLRHTANLDYNSSAVKE